jgi:hypothetical protein
MQRIGTSTLFDLPLLDTDEVMARIDAVRIDDLRALVEELWAPGGLSAAGIGPDEDAFRAAVEGVAGARVPRDVAGRDVVAAATTSGDERSEAVATSGDRARRARAE